MAVLTPDERTQVVSGLLSNQKLRRVSENSRFSPTAISALQEWNERYGEPPRGIDWDPARARLLRAKPWRADRFAAGTWPTLTIVRRQFGTWSDALAPRDCGHTADRAATQPGALGRSDPRCDSHLERTIWRAARLG